MGISHLPWNSEIKGSIGRSETGIAQLPCWQDPLTITNGMSE